MDTATYHHLANHYYCHCYHFNCHYNFELNLNLFTSRRGESLGGKYHIRNKINQTFTYMLEQTSVFFLTNILIVDIQKAHLPNSLN